MSAGETEASETSDGEQESKGDEIEKRSDESEKPGGGLRAVLISAGFT